jgi:hypothetical protein
VEKYGRARQATDDNIIQRMRFACWIIKLLTVARIFLYLLLFRGCSDFATTPPCYVNTRIACLIYILYARAVCYEVIQVSYVTLVSIFLPDDGPCKVERRRTP